MSRSVQLAESGLWATSSHPALLWTRELIVLFGTLVILFSWLPAHALSEPPAHLLQDDPNIPWHISADVIQRDLANDRYSAEGNVTIVKGDRRLNADFVTFDYKTMKAAATGHVSLTAGEDVISGSKIEIDLNNETGTIYDGSMFISENHFHIKGRRIRKTGKDTYMVEDASVSTCDADIPAWKITGRKLNITIEGYGTISHAALWAKKIPVLYTPYLFFPVKIKRQSGLLFPQFAITDRKGATIIQPYFWAISDSSDATLYYHYMKERGHKIGAEYRYVRSDLSQGTGMADFLNDRKVDDGTVDAQGISTSRKWGYEDDGVLRPNSDRYWLRMKNDHKLPGGFSAKLDLDVVSDQDYLKEFRDGYTGYDDTHSYFLEHFGRGLDDYNDPIRTNRVHLGRVWPNYSLNTEARWNDNVIARRLNQTDKTLQQLPFLGFDAAKQQISEGPFFFDLQSSYTHLYQEDGSKGHRSDVYPRLYLPYNYKNYFSLEPSAGVRGTAWYITDDDRAQSSGNQSYYRGIYDLRLDLSSDLFSVFNFGSRHFDKIKHAVRPRVVYEYLPSQNQESHPSFDALDRIAARNLITYSLLNTFTARSKPSNKAPRTASTAVSDQRSTTAYHQFARLKLEQSYDINKASDGSPEPFSPISGELDLVLGNYVSLKSDALWSPYHGDFQSHNIAANFSDNRGDRLFVEHRYTQSLLQSIYSDLFLNLTEAISVFTSYEYNLQDNEKIESRLGVMYKAQCWAVNVRYVDSQTDRKFEFMVTLTGLGEVGTNISGRTVETPFR